MTTTESGPLGALRALADQWDAAARATRAQDGVSRAECAMARQAESCADALRPIIEALATPGAGVGGRWISVTDRLPGDGVLVMVYAPDAGDGERIDFDGCEDGRWVEHGNSREHFVMVGGASAAGPDCTCTGPAEDAPYTHWMPLPPSPTAPQAAAQVTDDAMTKIADSLDCFWNAALGAAQTGSTHGEMNMQQVIGCIAEGVSAIANRMREHAALRPNASTGEVDRG